MYSKTELTVGDKFYNESKTKYLKIMAISDGYVMCRFKGCVPFCEPLQHFIHRLHGMNLTK